MGKPLVVCLDTNIIIWGVKGESSSGQGPMVGRAKAFIAELEASKARIVVPAVVVAEALIKVPKMHHQRVLEVFERRFMVAPFDARAGSCYASLFQTWLEKNKKHTKLKTPKRDIKPDFMIVATAIAAGATKLYSSDAGMRAFALGHIDAEDLPAIPVQHVIDEF